jgi:hypothetical protein
MAVEQGVRGEAAWLANPNACFSRCVQTPAVKAVLIQPRSRWRSGMLEDVDVGQLHRIKRNNYQGSDLAREGVRVGHNRACQTVTKK